MLLVVWGMCFSFYITHAMIGRKKTNDSLEKRQSAPLDLAAKKILFCVFAVFALKMDKFPKKKPCSITPQERANQYPRKFHADDNLLFCSTCNVIVDHHLKSAVSHIKRMNESSSKRANKKKTLADKVNKLKQSKYFAKKILCNSHNPRIIWDSGHTIRQKIVRNLRKKHIIPEALTVILLFTSCYL